MILVAFVIYSRNGRGHLIPLNLKGALKIGLGAWLGFFAIGMVLWGINTV